MSYLSISSQGKFVRWRFSFNKSLRSLDKTQGVLPIMAYTGRLHPKGVPFSGFGYIKGVEILLFEYMEGQENLSFRSVKKPKRDNRYILWLLKSRENVLDL